MVDFGTMPIANRTTAGTGLGDLLAHFARTVGGWNGVTQPFNSTRPAMSQIGATPTSSFVPGPDAPVPAPTQAKPGATTPPPQTQALLATQAATPVSTTDGPWLSPGYMSQNFYKQQAAAGVGTADWGGLLPFLQDWASKGGRGVQGGDGNAASYEQVLMDLANRGYDVSQLPQHAYTGPSATQAATLDPAIVAQLAQQRSQAGTDYNQLLAQLDLRQQQGDLNTQDQLRQYGEQTAIGRANQPNQYLDRGIFNSGIQRQGLQNFLTGRAEGENGIRNQYTQLLQNIDLGRQQAGQQYQQRLSSIDADEQARKAQRVADLRAQGLVSQ